MERRAEEKNRNAIQVIVATVLIYTETNYLYKGEFWKINYRLNSKVIHLYKANDVHTTLYS